MGLANKLKNHMPKQAEYPLWKGPEVDGITQSMLSRFLTCRERFRIRYLEGVSPVDRFNPKLFYGHLWHACREADLEDTSKLDKMSALVREESEKFPFDKPQINRWFHICRKQYRVYKEWLRNNQFPHQKAETVASEKTFDVPYYLPCGTIVRLRGKFDGVIDCKGKDWLVENKTKGQISAHKINNQLKFDLQTMLYLSAMQCEYFESQTSRSIGGIIYEVVRRPLSGGKGTIRQKKARGKTPAETDSEFYKRLGEVFSENPDEFFFSWEVPVTQQELKEFQIKFLTPTLKALVDWYNGAVEAGKQTPFNNPHHYVTPFELFRPLQELGSTELDDYILDGDMAGLTRNTTLFEELDS